MPYVIFNIGGRQFRQIRRLSVQKLAALTLVMCFSAGIYLIAETNANDNDGFGEVPGNEAIPVPEAEGENVQNPDANDWVVPENPAAAAAAAEEIAAIQAAEAAQAEQELAAAVEEALQNHEPQYDSNVAPMASADIGVDPFDTDDLPEVDGPENQANQDK